MEDLRHPVPSRARRRASAAVAGLSATALGLAAHGDVFLPASTSSSGSTSTPRPLEEARPGRYFHSRLRLAHGDEEEAGSGAALSLGAVALAIAAAGLHHSRRNRPGESRTAMAGFRRRPEKKKKRRTGPRTLEKGSWSWDDEEDADLYVFDVVEQEDLPPEDPVAIKNIREIAHYTSVDGRFSDFSFYTVPEYRPPQKPLQLEKGKIVPQPVDQGPEIEVPFTDTILKALSKCACVEDATADLENADIVIGLDGLRLLLSWLDGDFSRDIIAKGMHTARKKDGVQIDMFRLVTMPEAPNALVFARVWDWVRRNMTPRSGSLGTRSYDVSMVENSIGRVGVGGPPSVRYGSGDLHYRILSYDCGGLKMVVRVPITACVPAADADAFERPGMGVDISSANRRDEGELWNSSLPTRYTGMKLGDVGMIARGIVDKGSLISLQELTQEDLALDRPSLEEDAGVMLGRLVRLLRRVKHVAASPGCQDQPLYLQYVDYDLRVIAPRFEDEDPVGWSWDDSAAERSDTYVAPPVAC